jgi:hypothetical protein
MNRVDESIVNSLRDRAEGSVRVEDLLEGARRRGVRRRGVRRAFTGAGVGALALAVAGVVTVLPLDAGGPAGTDGVGAASAGVSAEPGPPGRPPVAAGSPALGQGGRPGGGLFHLDVKAPAPERGGFSWRSGTGWEHLHFSGGPDTAGASNGFIASIGDSEASLDAAQQASGDELHGPEAPVPATVDGKPATFTSSGMNAEDARWGYVRWQPVPGVWAQLFASFSPTGTNLDTDLATLVRGTQEVRFDRVYRCAVNFTLSWVPAGATVTGCQFSGGQRPMARSFLTVGGRKFSIFVTSVSGEKPVNTNAEYAGIPLEYGESRVRRVAGDREISVDQETEPLTREDALRLAASVEPIAGTDPADWPAGPLR